MPKAQRTITIGRPPDVVFGFFTDHGNDRTWRANVITVDPVREAPAGTRVSQVIKGPMGRGIRADIEVTANQPPTRYAFEVVRGPVRPRGEFRFAPAANGTDVDFMLTAELGAIQRLLMGKSVQASMDGEMAGLDRAKAALERG